MLLPVVSLLIRESREDVKTEDAKNESLPKECRALRGNLDKRDLGYGSKQKLLLPSKASPAHSVIHICFGPYRSYFYRRISPTLKHIVFLRELVTQCRYFLIGFIFLFTSTF